MVSKPKSGMQTYLANACYMFIPFSFHKFNSQHYYINRTSPEATHYICDVLNKYSLFRPLVFWTLHYCPKRSSSVFIWCNKENSDFTDVNLEKHNGAHLSSKDQHYSKKFYIYIYLYLWHWYPFMETWNLSQLTQNRTAYPTSGPVLNFDLAQFV